MGEEKKTIKRHSPLHVVGMESGPSSGLRLWVGGLFDSRGEEPEPGINQKKERK